MTEHENIKMVFTVTNPGQQPFALTLAGRNLWALEQLMRAGRMGCTPINSPAPRWAAYVHNLRRFGVQVETIAETHGGKFAGSHARYVLTASVTPGTQAVAV